MKIGVMQPYFFPYIPYFQLMESVDKYVIFDDVNFIKRGYIQRNSVLSSGNSTSIHLLLSKASQNKKINEIELLDDPKEKKKTIMTIENSYKNAPYFSEVMPLINEIMNCDERNLSLFLLNSLKKLRSFLEIDVEILLSSDIKKNNELKGQDKIIEICKCLEGDEYHNAIGGVELYDDKKFDENNIKLKFIKSNASSYKQFKNEFVPNLSIIDTLMFNSKEALKVIMNEYELVDKKDLL